MPARNAQLDTVNVTVSDGVATIELNRPHALNAFDRALCEDLLIALGGAGEDARVRAVLITGAGRGFSAGADVSDLGGSLAEGGPPPDVQQQLIERYHPIMMGIRALPKPVLAAVHGAAAGVGCSLALCCDLILAAESSYFLLAFVNIGLVPDGGCSLLLPTRIGAARATEMAMLGERIAAPQALDWGLINRVVPDELLREQALALATRLASGPTQAYGAIKRQFNNCLYAGLTDQLELEAALQQEMVSTADFREGVSAFAHRRPAQFEGR